MDRARGWWLLSGLLLIALLIPIWIGPYPPLYDYPNHLLEAQIVAHYTEPQWNYAPYYVIRSGWYLQSNALSTLLLIGLGSIMPMTVAGQLVLSLYLALFVGGLALWIRRTSGAWSLLLLAPVFAYNLTFTSGWLNFSYGVALGLYVLVVYLRWQAHNHHVWLLVLAVLLLLIYIAHLMAWLLMLLVLATMATVDLRDVRRFGLIWLATLSALPVLLLTRPLIGGVAALIGPSLWLIGALIRRLRWPAWALATTGAVMFLLLVTLVKVAKPIYRVYAPEIRYDNFEKLIVPLQTWSLPSQFTASVTSLTAYNSLLLALLLILALLVMWSTGRVGPSGVLPFTAAVGVLGLVYVFLPSRTHEIWITEPRSLILATIIMLAAVRLPSAGTRLRSTLLACALLICCISVSGTSWYAYQYNQQVQAWRMQLAALSPARSVLLLRGDYVTSQLPQYSRVIQRSYKGEHFSTVYALEWGGFTSRIFSNGPVAPDPSLPLPLYYWGQFDQASYVRERCTDLTASYDAVLVWGTPRPDLTAALDQCFRPDARLADIAIWRRSDQP